MMVFGGATDFSGYLGSINGKATPGGYDISHLISSGDLIATIQINSVPEPSAAILLGLGVSGPWSPRDAASAGLRDDSADPGALPIILPRAGRPGRGPEHTGSRSLTRALDAAPAPVQAAPSFGRLAPPQPHLRDRGQGHELRTSGSTTGPRCGR